MPALKRSHITNQLAGGFFTLLLLLCAADHSAQGNAAARYEIDAKRIGVSPTGKDALPRSREFLRLDSTYYVGWMYEGLYKYERSADYLGYRNAIAPLHKALTLIEKDFGNKLRNIFSSIEYFQQNANRYDDLYQIATVLRFCYNNNEQPDSTMALLDRLERYHFQKDFFNINVERAWTYHRHRFFTSSKYPFLKNSITGNEAMAFACCYRQLEDIERNRQLNDYWYGAAQSEDDKLTVYHYLALLHDYNQNYDSSQFYYSRLIEGGRVSWANFAHLQHEVGNFSLAAENFSKSQYRRRFSLSEPDYYLPILLVYGGRTKDAINMVRQKIDESGSTPGFGWYNIALARSYLYDGQLDSCDFFLDKAANFKEVHIGTTLTQSQYEFSINLLRIQSLDKKIRRVKFFNKGWWYSPGDLLSLLGLRAEKLMLEYAVVNALANNPERKRIVYDLFCGESTVSYDESLYLLKDFSVKFFKEKYSEYPEHDRRKKIYRYFKLFAARFKFEDGDEEEAMQDCKDILSGAYTYISESDESQGENDKAFENLFYARLYEMVAQYYDGDDPEGSPYRQRFLEEFPQLVPFSGIRMKMNITYVGEDDELIKQVREDLEDCNIEATEEVNAGIPQARIQFNKKGSSYQAVINVISGTQKEIVTDGQMVFKKAEGVGRELALRLFAKGGAVKFEAEKGM